jgi:predicted ABC-type ATPase
MRAAKKAGYRIDLVFIGLAHPALGAERVAARVAKGGHHVPPADIARRYERSMENLPKALLLADWATILDNSNALEPFRLIARIRSGRVTHLAGRRPEWLDRTLARYALATGRLIGPDGSGA